MVCPKRTAKSSVTSPRKRARGMSARKFCSHQEEDGVGEGEEEIWHHGAASLPSLLSKLERSATPCPALLPHHRHPAIATTTHASPPHRTATKTSVGSAPAWPAQRPTGSATSMRLIHEEVSMCQTLSRSVRGAYMPAAMAATAAAAGVGVWVGGRVYTMWACECESESVSE